jgi:hypothetical protein
MTRRCTTGTAGGQMDRAAQAGSRSQLVYAGIVQVQPLIADM